MREIESPAELEAALRRRSLENQVIQDLDLEPYADRLRTARVRGAVFLGCATPPDVADDLVRRGAMLFPKLGGLPFNPYRRALYTTSEIYAGFDPGRPASYAETLDARIYDWWRNTGGAEPHDLSVTLARRLHDLSIDDAITDFLASLEDSNDDSAGPRRVAIMGGHSLARSTGLYRELVWLSRHLAARGDLLLSGGGPGAMEAAHLGTWLVDASDATLDRIRAHLAGSPEYHHPDWLRHAFEVLERELADVTPRASLSIPTWLYGHEPPNPFASQIAKLFNNSLREEGLVTLATGGIVFAPGSAGTVQEIFQDGAQNHYAVGGRICPMVFLDRHYWTKTLPVWPLVRALSAGRAWADRIALVDRVEEVPEALDRMPTIVLSS